MLKSPKPHWRRVPFNLLLALLNAYGLSVAGFLLLRALVGERWSLIALFNSGAHLLFLPAIVLLPVALLLRRRLTAGLLVPALLAFLISYGSSFVPRTAESAPGAVRLPILTYNMKAQAANLNPALTLIREADADIVALQELSVEMGEHIQVVLADEYPYQALHTDPLDPISGQGLLSRYPITSDDYWRIYRAMQRVTLDIRGRTVVFYNAHPTQPISRNGFSERAEEISDLLTRATQETDPVILAGDFNMSDQSADYGRISAQFQDTYRTVGWGLGLTFPADVPYFGGGRYGSSLFRLVPPLIRLDYVFHDATFTSLEARVWSHSGGSDHLPVFVTLAMQ